MSTTDLIIEWGADHIVDAMRQDEWFALAVFDSVANATEVAKTAAAFGKTAEQNGCTMDLSGIAARLRLLADIFDAPQDKTP